MFIVCINAQREKDFYYIRHKSGSYLFSHRSKTVFDLTNKITGHKATLTLQMYCGLHFQVRL
jgi:hypothetical protein